MSVSRQLTTDVISWCAIAGMLFYIGSNFDRVREYVGKNAAEIARSNAAATKHGQDDNGQPKPAIVSDGVELRADSKGQYETTMEVNGRSIDALVDTGASIVLLRYEDAQRAGIFLRDSDFTGRAQTANGTSRIAPVTLERVSIGSITVRDVRGAVAEPGRLNVNLLGMTFLQKLRKFEVRSGRLILQD
jgi:aspartyl protease family protein